MHLSLWDTDVTLSGNLTIPANVHLDCINNTLTVPGGVMLTVEGTLYATLTLRSGSTLAIPEGGRLLLQQSLVEENVTLDVVPGTISVSDYTDSGVQDGIPSGLIALSVLTNTADLLDTALGYCDTFYSVDGTVSGFTLNLRHNTTLPANFTLTLGIDNFGSENSVLVIPAGVTVVNYGELILTGTGILRIEEGGTLVNLGKLTNKGGTVENNGTLTSDPLPYGSCGDGLSWSFDKDSGMLTISASGEMAGAMTDFTSGGAPWYGFRESITAVEMTAGTSLGAYAFEGCKNLTEFTVPASVTAVGGNAFLGCNALTKLTFLGDAPSFDENAFAGLKAVVWYDPAQFGWDTATGSDYGGQITYLGHAEGNNLWVSSFDQLLAALEAATGSEQYWIICLLYTSPSPRDRG